MQLPPLNRKVSAGLLVGVLCLPVFAACQTQNSVAAATRDAIAVARYTIEFTYNAPRDAPPGEAERFKKVLNNHQSKLVGRVTSQGDVLLDQHKFAGMTTAGVTQGANHQVIHTATATSKVQQIEGALGFKTESDMRDFMADLGNSRRTSGKR